jgi:adenylyltransferase/sulfurtransferase
MMERDLSRYARQIRIPDLGEAGQRRLLDSRVFICGCGALGTVLADTLVRAGVGFVRLVDRDFVEATNLQRQVLFDEQDIADELPKAIAAARKLSRINSDVTIEPIVADVEHTNVLEFARGTDLILDGTDNFETRFLLNDASLELGIPWIYAGCIATHGQTMTILPAESACLRCLIDTAPQPGTTETCDTAGILGPTVNIIASLQAVNALKLLAGRRDLIEPVLTIVDVWDFTLRKMSVRSLRERANCPACLGGERLWLSGRQGSQTTVLCGRNAVQVSPPGRTPLRFEELAEKLRPLGRLTSNPFLLRFSPDGSEYELTAFADGRVIVRGTDDPATARGLCARYIGN